MGNTNNKGKVNSRASRALVAINTTAVFSTKAIRKDSIQRLWAGGQSGDKTYRASRKRGSPIAKKRKHKDSPAISPSRKLWSKKESLPPHVVLHLPGEPGPWQEDSQEDGIDHHWHGQG